MKLIYLKKDNCLACELLEKAIQAMKEKIQKNVEYIEIECSTDDSDDIINKYNVFVVPCIILQYDDDTYEKFEKDNPDFNLIIKKINEKTI